MAKEEAYRLRLLPGMRKSRNKGNLIDSLNALWDRVWGSGSDHPCNRDPLNIFEPLCADQLQLKNTDMANSVLQD